MGMTVKDFKEFADKYLDDTYEIYIQINYDHNRECKFAHLDHCNVDVTNNTVDMIGIDNDIDIL